MSRAVRADCRGDRHCYTLGCGSAACTEAHRLYASRRRRLIAYDRWGGKLIPADGVKRQIAWLRSGGASNRWLASQLGVSEERASQLARGTRGKVRASTADRVARVVAWVEAGELVPPGWSEPPTRRVERWLPVEPIVRVVEERGGFAAVVPGGVATASDAGAIRRSYLRAKQAGTITDALADRLCVELLGLHPCEVYGEQWWQLDAPDSSEPQGAAA